MGLQNQPLYMLKKFTDGIDVGLDQLKALDLGVGAS